jgi:23S rRNA (guanosine2251-2'-O)-methyltransferase
MKNLPKGPSRNKKYGERPAGRKPDEKSKVYPQKQGSRRLAQSQKAKPQRQQTPRAEKLPRKGVLLWGLHAVKEAWLNPQRKPFQLWLTDAGMAAMESTLQSAIKKGLVRPTPSHVEKAELERLLPEGSVHQGIVLDSSPLADMSLDDFLGKDAGTEVVIVLDQVTDPHNVGAILRSAAAFGAGAVIVTERNAPSTTGTLAKTACGALEHVPLISVVNIARALEALKDESYWCVGLAEEGEKDLSDCALSTGRIALVMGAEGDGLRRLTRERCDELARLPTQGPIGSLNVSNAAAVSLYETRRQRLVNKGE